MYLFDLVLSFSQIYTQSGIAGSHIIWSNKVLVVESQQRGKKDTDAGKDGSEVGGDRG